MEIKIHRTEHSRLKNVDFNDIPFGKHMSDHMFVCDYKEGTWQNPRIEPYRPLSFEPTAKVFHYGQAVFEGMKAYRDEDKKIFLFRPDENQKRINKSAVRMDMPAFPEDLFHEGLHELLRLDQEWIPTEFGKSFYIRPFMIATENQLAASPSSEFMFMIIGGPVGAYFAQDVKVKIADYYSRAANGGVGFAKAAGNYAGQFYPTRKAQEEGFHQVIWTDDATHQYIEEAGVMNLWFRVGDKLLTAPTSERILDGVTRKSILQLAQDMGIEVEVRPVSVKEIMHAYDNGDLKEAFGCGTAAVVSPICAIGYKDKMMELENNGDRYSEMLKKKMVDLQNNLAEDPYGWRVEVK